MKRTMERVVAVAVFGVVLWTVAWDARVRCVQWIRPCGTHAIGEDGLPTPLPADAPPAPLISFDADTHYWVHYAHTLLDQGRRRLRHTDWDNAPWGRSMHWSNLPIALLAWPAALMERMGLGSGHGAIERAWPWAGPLSMLGVLVVLGIVLGRSLGALRAAFLLLAWAALHPVRKDFALGRYDHAALLSIATLGLLLPPVLAGMGWGAFKRARAAFAVSAFSGATGLWIQASLFAPILAASGGGLGLCLLLLKSSEDSPDAAPFDPGLWRWWGWAGGLFALLFYGLEYWPGMPAMRLEVNHPLYASAWIGGGEALYRLGLRATGRVGRAPWWSVAAALLPLAVLVAAIAAGPVRWFQPRDPTLVLVHKAIGEFMPFTAVFRHAPLLGALTLSGLFGALPVVAAYPAFRRAGPARARAAIGLTWLPTLAAAFMAWRHVRFAGLFATVALALAVAILLNLRARAWLSLALAAVLAAGGLSAWGLEHAARSRRDRAATADAAWVARLRLRDAARALKGFWPKPTPVVMTGFDESAALQAFGGARCVGGLYWENREGLRDTAAFFADHGEAEARDVARRRGVDYVLAPINVNRLAELHFVRFGFVGPEDLPRSLGYRLARGRPVPGWLTTVHDERLRVVEACGYRLYRVTPP